MSAQEYALLLCWGAPFVQVCWLGFWRDFTFELIDAFKESFLR
jgi:hypothetical protein